MEKNFGFFRTIIPAAADRDPRADEQFQSLGFATPFNFERVGSEDIQTSEVKDSENKVDVFGLRVDQLNKDILWNVNQMAPQSAVSVRREVEDGRVLNYQVIDGNKIELVLPKLFHVYKNLKGYIEEFLEEELTELPLQSAINVNIVEQGGQQGFHTYRNEVTILLYLTNVEEGGQLEFKTSTGETHSIAPVKGTLVLLAGANETPHRVAEVKKGRRVAIAFAYGKEGKDYNDKKGRDDFLYSNKDISEKQQRVFDSTTDSKH